MPEGRQLDRFERIERALIRMGRRHAKPDHDPCMTLAQYIPLRYIAERPRMPSELADYLGITSAGITGLVNRLCSQGLVQRYRDESDRRLVWVSITDQGRAALQQMSHYRKQHLSATFGELTDDELDTFVGLLEKVAAGGFN